MNYTIDRPASDDIKSAFSFSSFHSGLLKLAVLRILSVQPMPGYALIKEIERMSDRTWKPSPGSIYPALESLLKGGVITQEVVGRKRVYHLTPKGEEVLGMVMGHAKMAVTSMQNILNYTGPEVR